MIHAMYAALLTIAGSLLFAGGLYIIAGSEIAMAALTLIAGAGVASLGLYLLGAAVVIISHKAGVTDWLKERMQ